MPVVGGLLVYVASKIYTAECSILLVLVKSKNIVARIMLGSFERAAEAKTVICHMNLLYHG
jgi:hypothetical protein